MSSFWDQVIAALIGAVVGGTVNLFFDYIKESIKTGGKPSEHDSGKKASILALGKKGRFLFYILIGVVFGLLTWSLVSPQYQKTLFTFDNGTDSWEPLSKTNDAAWKTEYEPIAKALVAKYNFAQTDSSDPDPRATFYYDNFNDTWSGYKTFNLEFTNPNGEHLEMTISVDVDGCFQEFGEYENLSPGTNGTASFDFTKPRFKTCGSPNAFDQSLDTSMEINRIYLIIGTNVKPADFGGQILVDNIRLKKDPFYFRLFVAGVVLIIVGVIGFIEYTRQKRNDLLQKEDSNAKPVT